MLIMLNVNVSPNLKRPRFQNDRFRIEKEPEALQGPDKLPVEKFHVHKRSNRRLTRALTRTGNEPLQKKSSRFNLKMFSEVVDLTMLPGLSAIYTKRSLST